MNKKVNKYKQTIVILLIPSVVIIMFFVLSVSNGKPDTSVPTTTSTSASQPTSENIVPEKQNTTQDIQPTTNYSSLNVDPDRCRGCGRCVGIDPEHFEMNSNVAQVISENNLDSQSLTSAISACPADSINLS